MVAGKEVDGWWDLDYAILSPSPGRLNTKRTSQDTEQINGWKILTKEFVEAVLDKLVIVCHLVDHNSKASHTTLHYLHTAVTARWSVTHCQIIFIRQQVRSKTENIFLHHRNTEAFTSNLPAWLSWVWNVLKPLVTTSLQCSLLLKYSFVALAQEKSPVFPTAYHLAMLHNELSQVFLQRDQKGSAWMLHEWDHWLENEGRVVDHHDIWLVLHAYTHRENISKSALFTQFPTSSECAYSTTKVTGSRCHFFTTVVIWGFTGVLAPDTNQLTFIFHRWAKYIKLDVMV